MIPVTDDQAKAIQSAFKFGSDALDLVKDFARRFNQIFGTIPDDLAGLWGDNLRTSRTLKQMENADRVARRAEELLEQRRIRHPEKVPLTLGIPLLEAAANESRDELVELWARLLANAMDPAHKSHVRLRFIEILRRMDPLDSRVLDRVPPGASEPCHREYIAKMLGEFPDAVEVSLRNLTDFGLIFPKGAAATSLGAVISDVYFTSLGREMLRAVKK